MKKHTGKVLSLVLALAMVVSCFSSTLVSAVDVDTNYGSGKATITLDSGKLVLVPSTTDDGAGKELPTAELKFTDAAGNPYTPVETPKAKWSLASNSYVKFNDAKTKIQTIKGAGVGTAVATVAFSNVKCKFTDTNGDHFVTVSATAQVTIKTIKDGSYVISDIDPKPGTEVVPSFNLSVNDEPEFAVYKVAAGDDNAATYTKIGAVATAEADKATFETADKDTVNLNPLGKVTKQAATKIKLNQTQIRAYVYETKDTKAVKPATPSATALVTVKKTYNAAATTTITADTSYGSGGRAKIDDYDVTGYDILAGAKVTLENGVVNSIKGIGEVEIKNGTVTGAIETSSALIIEKGRIGSVKGTGAVTVNDAATVGNIETDGAVTITAGTVGTITSKDAVSVSKATTGAITAAKAVTIDSANVGGNVSGEAVTITSAQTDKDGKYIATTVSGNVTGKGLITIGVNAQAAIRVAGGIIADGSNIAITQPSKVSVTVGGVSGKKPAKATDSCTTELTLNGVTQSFASLPYFKTIILDTAADVKVNSALTVDTLTLNSGKITVPEAGLLNIAGPGAIAVPAGKLVVKTSVSGAPTLLASGATKGTVLFKSISGMADKFSTPGLTLEEVNNNDNTYSYRVKNSTFAGITIDKSFVKVAKNYSTTVKLAINPTGETLPAENKVKWVVDAGKNVTVTPSADGLSAVITATNWSDVNLNNANEAVVTAMVLDKDGYQDYKYATVECKVTVIEKPEIAVSFEKTEATVRAFSKNDWREDALATATATINVVGDAAGALPVVTTSDDKIATVGEVKKVSDGKYTVSVKGVVAGKANIVATVAGVASAPMVVTVNDKATGWIMLDTVNYKMAPNGIFDIGVKTSANFPKDVEIKASVSRDAIARIDRLATGNIRVTGRHEGTCYVVYDIVKDGKVLAHASIKFDVVAGAKAGGSATRATTFFDVK